MEKVNALVAQEVELNNAKIKTATQQREELTLRRQEIFRRAREEGEKEVTMGPEVAELQFIDDSIQRLSDAIGTLQERNKQLETNVRAIGNILEKKKRDTDPEIH